jgi:hypothetical protein
MLEPKLTLQVLIVALFIMPCITVAVAAEQTQAQKETQTGVQGKGQIYGSQLMTREERAEHRARLRSLKTREEREAYLTEHRKKMRDRAHKLGKTHPDTPMSHACEPGCVNA